MDEPGTHNVNHRERMGLHGDTSTPTSLSGYQGGNAEQCMFGKKVMLSGDSAEVTKKKRDSVDEEELS